MTLPDYRQVLRERTTNFLDFSSNLGEATIGDSFTFVYPNFGTPDGYPEHTAHRFHEVEVVARVETQTSPMVKVRAADGWEGDVFVEELFPLARSLPNEVSDLTPEGLHIEIDPEDGVTEEGSTIVKRSFRDLAEKHGIDAFDNLPTAYEKLAERYDEEFREIYEELVVLPAP